MILHTIRTGYSRPERSTDAAIHAAGLVAVTIAVPVLIALAIRRGDPATLIAGATIYGATLAAMVLFSALYNTIGQHRWTTLLKRLDHAAIFANIAGTYTVFALLPGSRMGHLVIAVWLLAGIGITLKLIAPDRLRRLTVAFYLALGWAGVLMGGGLLNDLTPMAQHLILTGGLVFTIGAGFYLWERLPFHYTIWHVFVLAGSAFLYGAVAVELLRGAA